MNNKKDIEVGDIYEDCAYHPVLCMGREGFEIWGISLIDGSQPRSCDVEHCGVVKLTCDEAWDIKINGPKDNEARSTISKKWW